MSFCVTLVGQIVNKLKYTMNTNADGRYSRLIMNGVVVSD